MHTLDRIETEWFQEDGFEVALEDMGGSRPTKIFPYFTTPFRDGPLCGLRAVKGKASVYTALRSDPAITRPVFPLPASRPSRPPRGKRGSLKDVGMARYMTKPPTSSLMNSVGSMVWVPNKIAHKMTKNQFYTLFDFNVKLGLSLRISSVKHPNSPTSI